MEAHNYGDESNISFLTELIENENYDEFAKRVYPGQIYGVCCQLMAKDKKQHLITAITRAYADSHRKDDIVRETLLFMRTKDGLQLLSTTSGYDTQLLNCICEAFPEQLHKLYANGGLTPIHQSLKSSVSDTGVLVSHGADINSRDRYGATILHHAAWANRKFVCEHLLGKGADASLCDDSGRTPQQIATQMNHHELANILTIKPTDEEIAIPEQNVEKQFKAYEFIFCDEDLDQLTGFIANIPREPDFDSFITDLQKSSHGSQGFALKTSDVERLKEEVVKLMKRISEIVEESDHRFKFDPVMTGSMKQGGKVGLPDEFDYNCILVEFSKLCKDVAEDGRPGFCRIIKISDLILEGYSDYFHDDGNLDMTSVNKAFFLLIEKALLQIYLHEPDVTHNLMLDSPGRRMQLPKVAHELDLRWNSSDIKNMDVKVDVASVLHFKAQSADIVPYSGLDTALFIPIRQTWMNDQLRRLCRISTTLQENAAFDTFNDQMKDGYGLLKSLISLMPDAQDFVPKIDCRVLNGSVLDKKPTTYHLKLALIRVVLRANESDNSCKEHNSLYWAREAVAELIAKYNDGVLTTPWNPEHNVLLNYKLKRDQWNLLEQSTIDLSSKLLKAYAMALSNILNQQNTVERQTAPPRRQADGLTAVINLRDLSKVLNLKLC